MYHRPVYVPPRDQYIEAPGDGSGMGPSPPGRSGTTLVIEVLALFGTVVLAVFVGLLLGGIMGGEGPTGPAGPTGPQGKMGLKGDTGSNGTDGKNGTCNCTLGLYEGSLLNYGIAPLQNHSDLFTIAITTQNTPTLIQNLRHFYERGDAFLDQEGQQYDNFTVLTAGNYTITLTIVWNQSDGSTPREFAFGFCGNCTYNSMGEVTSGTAALGAVQRAVTAAGDNNILGVSRVFPFQASTVVSIVVENTESTQDLNIAGISAMLSLLNP